jgi:hypothetical protein
MFSALRAAARGIAALVKSRRADAIDYPTRRPVDEILDVGYKFAHGPHSVVDVVRTTKDAA